MIATSLIQLNTSLAFSRALNRDVLVRTYYNPAKLAYDFIIYDKHTEQRLYSFCSTTSDISTAVHDFENQHPEALI